MKLLSLASDALTTPSHWGVKFGMSIDVSVIFQVKNKLLLGVPGHNNENFLNEC